MRTCNGPAPNNHSIVGSLSSHENKLLLNIRTHTHTLDMRGRGKAEIRSPLKVNLSTGVSKKLGGIKKKKETCNILHAGCVPYSLE